MNDTVIVSIVSLLSNFFTILGGVKLINYRIEQLEKKVEKYNTLGERMSVAENDIKTLYHLSNDKSD